ncbi:MAG: Ig-like domain-containing protein [Patescibacteria group bacterium]|nr:Ig-like domain-containing protein [Patescibacteria group bacterium]MDD5715326.1 Ig-like domain-containing protein [Patescibacteria group bacterium]
MALPNTNQGIHHKRGFLFLYAACTAVFILFVAVAIIVVFKQPKPQFKDAGKQVAADAELRFDFDWPVGRDVRIVTMPHVYGSVEYSGWVVPGHLARTVVFRPEVTWLPGVTYSVTVERVASALTPLRTVKYYTYSFTVQPSAMVASIQPEPGEEFRPDGTWTVTLDQPCDVTSSYEFRLQPSAPLETKMSADRRSFTIRPETVLSQGQQYTLGIYRKTLRYQLGTDTVVQQSDPMLVSEDTWPVPEAPGIKSFAPSGSSVGLGEQIVINFTDDIDLASLRENVSIEPELAGTWAVQDGSAAVFKPTSLEKATLYTITLKQGLGMESGGYLEQDAVHTFSTIAPVKVIRMSPSDGSTGISVNAHIQAEFDQAVDHASAENHFSISPAIDGAFSWIGTTMVFIPQASLGFNTAYTATIAAGIAAEGGYESESVFSSSFSTELSVTRLSVPFHRQEHNLSCEIATLVMALAYRGVSVSEAAIIDAIGFDETPKANGIWGNPNAAFVGDIDGHQPSTGYGVYWDPIANAAKAYRPARSFTGWGIADLTAEIKKGNPIIVWGTAGSGTRIDWKTPQGGTVVAVNGEHTRVVVGFIGSAENPTTIITLDPLSGEKLFTKDRFLWNWGLLGNSGVVVE